MFIDDFSNVFALCSKSLVHLTVCRYQIVMFVYKKISYFCLPPFRPCTKFLAIF